jgi:osmotically-inducible protein OsmY
MKPAISDEMLQDTVVRELNADPELDARHISLTAIDGAITLRGRVATQHEKHEAVRAAERVSGVMVVADEIEVREPSSRERSDDEIAEEVAHLRRRRIDSPDSVGVQVRDGRVILHGQVTSESQRAAAESAARQLPGVRAVVNLIKVRSETEPSVQDVERRVREAIHATRNADDDSINVTLSGSTVRLHGHVPSVETLQEAMQAAQSAPGVTAVECEIVVTIQKDRSR